MRKLSIYLLSLIAISIMYQFVLFFIIPLSAISVPLVLIICYQRYLYKDNFVGKILSILLTLMAVLVGILAHHIGWVYITGDWNNFLHPDAESALFLRGFTVINLCGALLVGLTYSFIKTRQRKQ